MINFTRTKIETSDEQNIAIGLITSDLFCEQIVPILKNKLDLIDSTPIRAIVSWSIDYFDRYQRAPGVIIQDLFSSNKVALPPERVESIEDVLLHLNDKVSQETNNFNVDYYATQSKNYIEKKLLEKTISAVQGALKQGNLQQARQLLTKVDKVEREMSLGVDFFNDPTFIKSIFSSMNDSVIDIPYRSLRELMGPVFPGDLISIFAGAKRSKSYMIQAFEEFAIKGGVNVISFSFEMTNEIVGLRRLQSYLAETKQPTSEPLEIPMFAKDGTIEYKQVTKKGLDEFQAVEFLDKMRKFGKIGKLRMFDAHSCGRTVKDIRDTIERVLNYDPVFTGKLLIIVDYDALLQAPGNFRGQQHEAFTQIWSDMKNLAQDYGCPVLMPSQMNQQAAAQDDYVDPTSASSSSSRKFDFTSLVLTLVKSKEEEKLGLARLYASGRHQYFSNEPVIVTQALGLGRAITDTRWMSQVPNYKDLVEGVTKEIMQQKVETVRNKKKETKKERKGFEFG